MVIFPFVELVTQVLSDQPLFFLINSYTTGLAPSVLTYLLETCLLYTSHVIATCNKYGMVMAFTGMRLFHH